MEFLWVSRKRKCYGEHIALFHHLGEPANKGRQTLKRPKKKKKKNISTRGGGRRGAKELKAAAKGRQNRRDAVL